ncbi:hypothetical protein D0863_01101 [Hortaea werneckii]|uniref:Uncharacterized protein n=1 Tax=Hortaea werneckii TaxID=91943 RepID=A0A3M7EMT7_HORWE|nr:hypothetical protein D0863_01101 [Hortaea werneckii]
MPRRYLPETMELDAITPAPLASPPQVHHTEGHSDVSRPPRPSRLRRLSELIDPLTLGAKSHVRSPSGQILGAAEFMAHPGRPLSIRERQEAIREKVRAATAKLAEEEAAAAAAAKKKRKNFSSYKVSFPPPNFKSIRLGAHTLAPVTAFYSLDEV